MTKFGVSIKATRLPCKEAKQGSIPWHSTIAESNPIVVVGPGCYLVCL